LALEEAAQDKARPSVAKFPAFCYVDDPAGHGKVLSLNRLLGAAFLAIIALVLGISIFKRRKG
ncbi:MAG: hypothetical protein PHF00_03050, partial [Elusimicrobia bacterium]|nr:hypothetical protein [Elusimicrobiota bacterium]